MALELISDADKKKYKKLSKGEFGFKISFAKNSIVKGEFKEKGEKKGKKESSKSDNEQKGKEKKKE